MKKWLSILLFTACATTPSQTLNNVLTAQQDPKSPFKFLNVPGYSSYPRFSKDGKSLYYVSAQRAGHSHEQVYRLDLNHSTDRRMTHSPGDSRYPTPTQDGDFYFFSETRQLRNLERAISKKMTPTTSQVGGLKQDSRKSFDLFHFDQKTSDITLVMSYEGYSGHGFAQERSNTLYSIVTFDQMEMIQKVIYQPKKTSFEKVFVAAKDQHIIDFTALSEDEFLAVVSDSDYSNHKVILIEKGKSRPLDFFKPGQYLSPLFLSKDSGLISFRASSKENFQIFNFNLKTACFENLLRSSGDHLFSEISPDQSILAFTIKENQQSRIALLDLPKQRPCE